MTQTELILFLLSIPSIGKQTILKLYREFSSFPAIYQASESDLKQVLSQKQLSSFLSFREKNSPPELTKSLAAQSICFYSIYDKAYPQRLLSIPDAPLGVFVKGTLPLDTATTVSIIGSRRNSYYGEKQTRLITQKLAMNHFEIISGMARGIDGIAHQVALAHKSNTYAVLGCGVNVCYPPENQYLFRQIPLHGGLISEYSPDTNPYAGFFPMRNRIISGLGDVLIVTEAREKSGTFITVDMALEQGKDIFVLPGRIDDPLSIGCNRLIAQGAHIILDFDELVEQIKAFSTKKIASPVSPDCIIASLLESHKIEALKKNKSSSKKEDLNETIAKHQLTKEEGLLLSLLDYEPQSLDTLYRRLHECSNLELSISDASICIMNLCFRKLARQENGSWYTKA